MKSSLLNWLTERNLGIKFTNPLVVVLGGSERCFCFLSDQKSCGEKIRKTVNSEGKYFIPLAFYGSNSKKESPKNVTFMFLRY